jgi:hypothetical protein
LADILNELDGQDDEWNTVEMQLPLKTERRLIMQPLGEPAIRRQDKFVRKANAIRETGTDFLDQTLKRFDGINSISDEARPGLPRISRISRISSLRSRASGPPVPGEHTGV